MGFVEVEEEADWQCGEMQIADKLGQVFFCYLFHGLEFKNDCLFHHGIDDLPAKFKFLVSDTEWNLLLGNQPIQPKFVNHRLLIQLFSKPRPKVSVNLKRTTQDAMCERVEFLRNIGLTFDSHL